MLIGELVEKTGLSRDTIRFYEKQGLITVTQKQRRKNNYKEYSNEVLERLLTVKRLKNFGFTLNEAAELLDMIEMKEATCGNVNELIERKVQLLEVKIKDMLSLRSQLMAGVKKCVDCCNPETPDDNCPILVTDNFLDN
ncbi:MAG: MerR family transcriptional regulator [Sphingobacterium sp.]|jgi:DNA-binding transcriptional MerR regulator|nr:MerR family transcriptional regulator [Sphingobacterium sp.]